MSDCNVDVLVGGQWGSEAKGLVAASIVNHVKDYDAAISVCSAQAGHTVPVNINGEIHYIVNRTLPSAAMVDHGMDIIIAPGSVINPEVMIEEIKHVESLGIPVINRLYISSLASVVTQGHLDESHSHAQEALRMSRDGITVKEAAASTREGVSQAIADRVRRVGPLVRDIRTSLSSALGLDNENFYDGWTQKFIDARGYDEILIEGSQGWGLSFYQDCYPHTTSRDCSAAGFISMACVAPANIGRIFGVYRTFPIRVAGKSGPMGNELTWEQVAAYSGYSSLKEITTVTKRVRRVAEFDTEFFYNSIVANAVTDPVLTFVNYLNHEDEGCDDWDALSDKAKEWIQKVEAESGFSFSYFSTNRSGTGWFS